jgi:epoxyqueuosine reductase
MKMNNVNKELQALLANAGKKSSIVSIQHLPDLQSDLETLLQQGILCRDFYDEIVSRYNDLQYNIEPPANFPEAKSIIITATPQPKIRVNFELAAKIYPIMIPPTYIHDSDEKVFNIISLYLSNKGYKISKAVLPEKSLAVHCGLAAYGKNNIAYMDGWGSFFRLKAFYSDIPCNSDNWQEFRLMERCNKCTACFKSCPTKAITNDRFLIDATRCITYLNEGPEEFPQWIDPAWHNCLMGCMICQDVCPANKELTNWIVETEDFSENETLMILNGTPQEDLPDEMNEKLKRLYMLDDYALLQRNLGVLINNCA